MINKLSAFHIAAGIIAFVVFLYTGYFMKTNFPDLYSSNESIRYLFRANHIYILFSGLVNIALGINLRSASSGWKKMAQLTGSFLLVAAIPVFIWAFFAEPQAASPMRPRTV